MLPQNLHRIAFSQQLIPELLSRFKIAKKKFVIDFSSPNIAKTFHMGNLRSTLYGNFLQKIYRHAGHEVVSINYLGDWGQQFAQLATYWLAVMDGREGRAQRPTAEQWANMESKERVAQLTSAYAAAYRMKKMNPAFAEKTRQLFLAMERTRIQQSQENSAQEENPPELDEAMALWRDWTQTSRAYLEDFYARFGVHFDVWDSESAHVEAGARLVDEMIRQGICTQDRDGTWHVKKQFQKQHDRTSVMAMRSSDGSNLYLNRELASIYARHRLYDADQYIYVVDREQAGHFIRLQELLRIRGDEELAQRVLHHSYGRVIGLSTREGRNESVDFLIDQGSKEALPYVANSPTRRTSDEEIGPLCRALAHTQLVFDLVRRANNSDFTFTYKGAFRPEGTNALILQEKYSRLNSLELAHREHVDCLRALNEDNLIQMRAEILEPGQKLARALFEFGTVLNEGLERREPAPITVYLIRLSNSIGRAMAACRVVGEPLNLALPRMLLFTAAKKVLGEGMQLVGMKPIERI